MSVHESGTRRLVLLRHAKAEPAGGVPDELRPLALTGRRQCAGVGARLAQDDLLPELAMVSSAVRTRQTWELVRGALGDVPPAEVDVEDRLYGAGPGELVELLRAVDDRVRTVLVVGHEPTMSGTASVLSADGAGAHLSAVRSGLSTASFAVLDVETWSTLEPGSARLVDVVRPGRPG